MDTLNDFKAAIVAAAGILTGLWGWMGWLVCGWVACMLLDWISGSIAAAKDGDWSSAKARAGILHKTGMVIVVVGTAIADLVLSRMRPVGRDVDVAGQLALTHHRHTSLLPPCPRHPCRRPAAL